MPKRAHQESGEPPLLRPQLVQNLGHVARCPPGPDMLEQMAVCFLKQLSPEEKQDVCAWIVEILRGSLAVGMICSGTDSPMLAWSGLSKALRSEFGVSLEVKQLYACEIDSAKRDVLVAALPQGCTLFKDAFELPKGFATTHDESQMIVPAVQWMIAGFPCTSMSSLNARAKHNRDCLRKRSAASGSVFGAIIDRMESQAGTLLAMTFENVPQIATGPPGASNLDTLIEVCSEVFCLDVVPWRLCPRDFGSPQSRNELEWQRVRKAGNIS